MKLFFVAHSPSGKHVHTIPFPLFFTHFFLIGMHLITLKDIGDLHLGEQQAAAAHPGLTI